MRTTIIISMIVMLFESCGFRIFENGHRIRRPTHSPAADSILTFNLGDSVRLPDSRAVVGLIITKSPTRVNYGYSFLLAETKAEAARLGGNMVRADAYHGVFRKKLYSTVYLLDPTGLARLKDSLAAVRTAHGDSIRDIAVVHIKDFRDTRQQYIRFNESVVDSVEGKGPSYRRQRTKTLILHSAGLLWIGKTHVAIQKGKEYYLVVYSYKSGMRVSEQLISSDKTHFEHRNMIFELLIL
jgi:hypothetical protein